MNSPRKQKSDVRKRLEKSGDKVRRARLPKRMRLAAKITIALDKLDLTNTELAIRLDKYSSEISKWLKGDHNFTIDTLSDIEEILGIRLLDLDDSKPTLDASNIVFEITAHSNFLKKSNDDLDRLLTDTFLGELPTKLGGGMPKRGELKVVA